MNRQIENKKYKINLENNDTTKELLNKLPSELVLDELNGNEKYKFLDYSLHSNPKNINKIHKGDVMLFGDNCLVIFYKDFNTSYRYTIIGHIEDESFTQQLNTGSMKWDVEEDVLPMWVADMDFKISPEILDAFNDRIKQGVLGYTLIEDDWYESYIHWWKKRHDLTIDKDSLLFTIGVVPAISSIVRSMTNIAEYVVVVSDEIHCDTTEPGKNYIPFAYVSDCCKYNSITCMAPSKAFNKGEEWLEELREYLWNNRRYAQGYIEKEIPELYVAHTEATYLLWIDCTRVIGHSSDLCQFLKQRIGLYLCDGSEYKNGTGFLRMNLATPLENVKEGLERLKKGIKEYQEYIGGSC